MVKDLPLPFFGIVIIILLYNRPANMLIVSISHVNVALENANLLEATDDKQKTGGKE